MKIYLATYQAIRLNQGGPTFKVEAMHKALQELDVDVEIFDGWNTIPDKGNLVHLFNASQSTYPLAMNLKPYGVKYVVNPIFFSNHKAAKLQAYRKLEKPFKKIFKRSFSDYDFTASVCREAEYVLPNTIAEGDLLVNGLDVKRDKVKVIHNGVEKRFSEADPTYFYKHFGLKDFVLYVGHLGPIRKNGMNIIKALGNLNHPAVIIADAWQDEAGRACVEEIKKYKNILYLNWVNHDDELLESAYAACHTFILPTRYETPGRAALEAGLAGANIVITPHGGTKDYFQDYALYPNPHDVNSITKDIIRSLDKPKTDVLKKHIMKNFIWEVIAKKSIEIYNLVD